MLKTIGQSQLRPAGALAALSLWAVIAVIALAVFAALIAVAGGVIMYEDRGSSTPTTPKWSTTYVSTSTIMDACVDAGVDPGSLYEVAALSQVSQVL
jgi:hypothetical protein